MVFHDIIPQPPGLVQGGLEFRLRLVGIEAVVGHQHYPIDLRHFLSRGQNAPVGYAAAVEHDHKLGVFPAKFKVFH